MKIRTIALAGIVGVPLFAGAALADTNTSLVTAAKDGDRAAVQTLLASKKQAVAGAEGTAALVWAATRNDVAMVDLLLKAGANAKAANEFGATALYAAAEHPDAGLTEKLLAAGANPNIALPSGETPLMAAARRGNMDTVRALIKGGANPNTAETNAGQTALMMALVEHHSEVVNELVKGGADVELASKSGFTPLMFAAQQGDAASTKILLKANAKPNVTQPKSGITALEIASAMAQAPVVDLLLDAGANPNTLDANGYAPLHKVVRDSDYGINPEKRAEILAITKSLLKHGADPNMRIKQDKEKIAAEIKAGANAFYGKRATVTVTEIVLQGATPIVLAAEVSNLDVIKALIDAEADPNIATDQGTTALMMTAGAGTDVQRAREPEERAEAARVAQYLLEHGADVNAAGQFGWTPLHAAAYQGQNEIISLLVAKGAKIDAKDKFGQTALSISMSVLTKEIGARRLQIPRRYREDTAKLLLKLGATPLQKSGVNVVLQRSGDENLGNPK